jgi:hypothetical protein
MPYYDFDLVFAADPGDDGAERLFDVFDGVGATILSAVVAGRPLLSVHLEGMSLESTIHEAVRLARLAGAQPIGVELEVEKAAA